MHELSVCQSILNQVGEIADQQHASTVQKIFLSIGPLAGVNADLLQTAFPLARADTVAANAELVIESMPIIVACAECGAESEVTINNLVCRTCGDWNTRLISGDEMILLRVELRREH